MFKDVPIFRFFRAVYWIDGTYIIIFSMLKLNKYVSHIEMNSIHENLTKVKGRKNKFFSQASLSDMTL